MPKDPSKTLNTLLDRSLIFKHNNLSSRVISFFFKKNKMNKTFSATLS